MRELIFVDTETGGLDYQTEPIVELTWANLYEEPETLWFGVTEVSPYVDELIKFTERNIAGRVSDHFAVERFLRASHDQTMVAANPSFDRSFLEINGLWKFHYRMLDIESYAMAKLGLDYVPSMKELTDNLRLVGFDIPEPDHTSRGDVLAMRSAYRALVKF